MGKKRKIISHPQLWKKHANHPAVKVRQAEEPVKEAAAPQPKPQPKKVEVKPAPKPVPKVAAKPAFKAAAKKETVKPVALKKGC